MLVLRVISRSILSTFCDALSKVTLVFVQNQIASGGLLEKS